MDKAQFEAILGRYNLPKEAHWERLLEGLFGHKMIRDIYFNTDEECLQPWAQDSEELIHLIRAVGKGGEIKVQPASGGAVTIKNKALQKYLLLSLHKLLFLRWQLDSPPSEEELKEGRKWILINGYREPLKVPFKNPLEDEEEGGFIQPFNEEELDTLLRASCWIKEAQKIARGRDNKNFAALGEAVISIKADCPPEALKMGKTDLLNYIADIMYLEGFFEGVQDALELSEELEKRLQNPGLTIGEVRRERQKMLTYWVKAAKEVKLKTTCKNCSQCADFDKCQIRKNLLQYDI